MLEDSTRARSEGDDIQQEQIALLDPYVRTDTKLLLFLSNGQPQSINEDSESTEFKRVDTSIKVYHLDEEAINKARRKIYIDVRNLVNRVERNPDNSEDAKSEILKMVRRDAEYASAARIYFRQYRKKQWVKELLEDL